MTPLSLPRRSFVYRRLVDAQMVFTGIGDASLGERCPAANPKAGVKLVDLSVLPRWGLKGRDAFWWLDRQGAKVPETDNRAERQPDGSLIARLSPAEALILSPIDGRASLAHAIERLPASGERACYPAPRRDSHCWYVIAGTDAPAMFAKLCGVDLAPDRFSDGQIAQTSVARLNGIVIRQDVAGALAFALLTDSASAEYLWDCLIDAMQEFAGAVFGADALRRPVDAATAEDRP